MSLYPSPFAFLTPIATIASNFDVSTFETGFDGWSYNLEYSSQGTPVYSRFGGAHTGSYCLGINGNGCYGFFATASKTVTCRAGNVTGWCRGESVEIIIIVNGTETSLGGFSGGWGQFSFAIPAGTCGIRMQVLEDYSAGGSWGYLDDVSFPIP